MCLVDASDSMFAEAPSVEGDNLPPGSRYLDKALKVISELIRKRCVRD